MSLGGSLKFFVVAVCLGLIVGCGGGGSNAAAAPVASPAPAPEPVPAPEADPDPEPEPQPEPEPTPEPEPDPVSVSISPSASELDLGDTLQFSASVANASDESVIWQVNAMTSGNATIGTISANGLYTAPGDLATCRRLMP